MEMADQEKADYYPRCPSCGVPFAEHLGLVGTCQQLTELRKRIANAIVEADKRNAYACANCLRDLLKEPT